MRVSFADNKRPRRRSLSVRVLAGQPSPVGCRSDGETGGPEELRGEHAAGRCGDQPDHHADDVEIPRQHDNGLREALVADRLLSVCPM